MDKAGIILVAIVGMLAWIALWIWLLVGLPLLPSHLLETKTVPTQPKWVRRTGQKKRPLWLTSPRIWLKSPQNEAHALRIFTWVAAVIFAGATWISEANSELGNFRTEATGIAIAVVFIEEVSRRRVYLEYKQAIIQQMASLSNDFALDAARIVKIEGWLYDGSLHGADLVWANLQGAVIGQASLQRVDLSLAKLQGANLWEAELQGAKLRGAELERADLAEANLEGADLIGADLSHTIVYKAQFRGARLFGANLRNTFLENAELQGALYNDTTQWPVNFDPVKAGAISTDLFSEGAQGDNGTAMMY